MQVSYPQGVTGSYKVGSGSGSSYYYMTNKGQPVGCHRRRKLAYALRVLPGSAGNTERVAHSTFCRTYLYFWKRTS
jgi:hypothetical protein